MARSSYCSQTGLKRGAWTPEEDRKLSAYITRYGHWNWRELPKFAGLERCGKSCRLRWMNYLRPNIKRGNYTREEEEIIINLHKAIGNRWSAIAAKLPGRTDNEIKNHWHTHLKKRSQRSSREREEVKMLPMELSNYERELQSILCVDSMKPSILESSSLVWMPLQKSTCEVSSPTPSDSDSGVSETPITDGNIFNTFEELGSNFWNEPFQVADSLGEDFTSILANLQLDFPSSPVYSYYDEYSMDVYSNHLILTEDMQPLL